MVTRPPGHRTPCGVSLVTGVTGGTEPTTLTKAVTEERPSPDIQREGTCFFTVTSTRSREDAILALPNTLIASILVTSECKSIAKITDVTVKLQQNKSRHMLYFKMMRL